MFIKYLKITKGSETIREIKFRKGINLIVDKSEGKITGNNVGKTTVLKLIDFCFGKDKQIIWEDPEHKSKLNTTVKNFLIENKILITLCLTSNLDEENAQEIIIERNFLDKKEKIRKINGEDYTSEQSFSDKLMHLFFPQHENSKPTFRQIVSHNFRYDNQSVINTLKTLNPLTKEEEYETLHLFLFGCPFIEGNERQKILDNLNKEENFKKRLEKENSRSAYESSLKLIEQEIDALNIKKSNLNLNPNFEDDLDKLNSLKIKINKIRSEITALEIRKNIILEAVTSLESSKTNIDMKQLKQIYLHAKYNIENLQKSFEDLVSYHNQMINEKVKYIKDELPEINIKLDKEYNNLSTLLEEEKKITSIISKTDTYEELDKIISHLNEQNRLKGECENAIKQINKVETNLKNYNESLKKIDDRLFSDDFKNKIQDQLNKFNKHFAHVSNKLYNEKYALKYGINNTKGKQIYEFNTFIPFGPNTASGKKQGEISSFDISYILFADEENMSCLHFILNDKKELMHDNQLVKIADLVNSNNIQFVASILKDKLPEELNKEEYFILELSEDDKLFRIEENT